MAPNSPVDPDGLLEYSVVYSDRALNHMSPRFQDVVRDLSFILKDTYNAEAAVIVPGSGTFGMEAVARQLATDKKTLILRNGWFSYRWTQILEMGKIATNETVLMARPTTEEPHAPFIPAPIEEVVSTIHSIEPDVVFAPHVETSSGMMLPDDYLGQVARAVHAHGGLFVLDCIASGAMWVDMQSVGVDVVLSAPQKGWSGSPCAAFVMLGSEALDAVRSRSSTSFACDLGKWLQIMEAYERGGHAYHATLPTDALTASRDVMREAHEFGLAKLQSAQATLGRKVRELLAASGFKSVAAPGFEAPGVVVSYTDDPDIKSGKAFAEHGVQIAAGVPLKCNEPKDFSTFRVGLFGLDKLLNVDDTVKKFEKALLQVLA